MQWARELVKKWLLKRNIVLSQPPGQFAVTSTKIKGLRNRGLQVSLVVDGGAAEGDWAREFKAIYPEAQVLCVEPRDASRPALEKLAAELPGIHIASTLLSATTGEVEFFQYGHQSSMLPTISGKAFGESTRIAATALDDLIGNMKLPWPDLIKLDLQGAELVALSGATQCLQHAQAIFLEVSFIAMQQGMPILGDVISFMKERGFVCYDIAGLWHRPLDGALAQGDFIFLKQDHKLLADRRWSDDQTWA
jgi:FkbM family methyltransferase